MQTSPPPGGSATPAHLFAYGSLVDARCLDDVLGRKHEGERLRACLRGFERQTAASYPFPFIVRADGGTVDGVLVTQLAPCDIAVLDRYEEVDCGVYRREVVEVEAWGCGPQPLRFRAFTYIAGPTLRTLTRSTAR